MKIRLIWRAFRSRFTLLQLLVHASAWLLVSWLLWDYLNGNLTVNPLQAATQRVGRYALYFLTASLACTPLNTLFGWRQVLKIRRALGLYAFLFAATHFSIFAGLDYGLDWSLLKEEFLFRRYIWVGLGAFTILIPLAFTSFRYWMKRLGKNWKRLHRLVYLAGILVIVHYSWAVKGDVLRLQGDIWKPLLFGILVALLLVLRLPPLRRSISGLRSLIGFKLGRSRGKLPPAPPSPQDRSSAKRGSVAPQAGPGQ
jgi:sulfoxide reductase heme-binding subunit YedZ